MFSHSAAVWLAWKTRTGTAMKIYSATRLSTKVINYLGKCFGYGVAYNKDDADSLQAAIKNTVCIWET